MLCRPNPFGAKVSTGARPLNPSPVVLSLGKVPLPDIAAMRAIRRFRHRPTGSACLRARRAARALSPFGFGRQSFSRPGAEGERVGVGHMDDRQVVALQNIRLRTFRFAPVRAKNLPPPGAAATPWVSSKSSGKSPANSDTTSRCVRHRSHRMSPRQSGRSARSSPRSDRS